MSQVFPILKYAFDKLGFLYYTIVVMNQRLKEILDTMDIPELRKTDIRWLNRNVWIRNSKHPDIEEALILIQIEFNNELPLVM